MEGELTLINVLSAKVEFFSRKNSYHLSLTVPFLIKIIKFGGFLRLNLRSCVVKQGIFSL